MRRARILRALAVAASAVATLIPGAASAAPTVAGQLVQTIDTSRFDPPSPDPSGLAFLRTGKLLMSDAEVEETPLWERKNVFTITTGGRVVRTFRTTRYSSEPTGIEATKRTMFVSDDDKDRIFVVGRGKDRTFGTRDDPVRSFPTGRTGCRDPEGIALGGGFLFIASGSDAKVCRLAPGPNGIFDGVAPKGDDRLKRFRTGGLGQPDPEGIEYRPASRTLFIVSNVRNSPVSETRLRGRLVRTIDTVGMGLHSPAGLAWGPASTNPNVRHLYIADRGVDNGADPNENDGRIFEISF